MADTKISLLPAVTTRAGTDEFAVNQGGTSKKETLNQIWTAPVFAAGSASADSTPRLTSGTLMTTPQTGALEYDGKVCYFTATANARGLLGAKQFSRILSDFTLANQTAAQDAFPTAQNNFTIDANTLYRITGVYRITTGGTASALQIAMTLTTATITDMLVWAEGTSAGTGVNGGGGDTVITDGTLASVSNSSTGSTKRCMFSGMIAIGTGGTLTPQVGFTADPTGTLLMKAGSYIMLEALSSDTVASVGNWG